MREILFRGKRLDNGEWEEGFFVEKKYPIIESDVRNVFILAQANGDSFVWFPVDPDTVGQYTGLLDKNGERIWEGDILRIAQIADGLGCYYQPPLDYPVNVVVKWDLCAWMWETLCEDKRYISFPNAWSHYECEIIGNIHNNSELLEETT